MIRRTESYQPIVINQKQIMMSLLFFTTALNTVISPNFLVWKFCGKAVSAAFSLENMIFTTFYAVYPCEGEN